MNTPPNAPEEESKRLIDLLRAQVSNAFYTNFERTFTVTILLTIVFIFYYCEHKLSLLGLFFLPIIVSGYFLNTRSTVLGGLMAILIVGFFFMMKPSAFTIEAPT